jgi:phage shock protein E
MKYSALVHATLVSGVLLYVGMINVVNATSFNPTQALTVQSQAELKGIEKKVVKPVIIDVRSKAEFIFGHHPEAYHLEYSTIRETISSLHLDKDAPIVLYCRSGRRAEMAKSDLEKLGFSNVVNGINLETIMQK